MKAIISTTYSNTYLYFLPIVTFCWNKLGVDVICFMPSGRTTIKKDGNVLQGVYPDGNKKMYLINETIKNNKGNLSIHCFSAPEHKEATYAQCLRNYACAIKELDDNEILCTGDVDMLVFKHPPYNENALTIWGSDLVPDNQFPMCYAIASVKNWRWMFETNGNSYQNMIDDLLGDIEAEHYKGNFWAKDQETLFKAAKKINKVLIPRTNGQTPFATHRMDRTDLHYMDRLDHDIIDAHLWRDGFTDENFPKILHLMQFMFPDEDFAWLVDYTNAYKELL